MSDIQDPLQVHIGIDLGTVFTKACFNCLDKNERAIVSWETGNSGFKNYFLPSTIYLTKSNYLCLEKPDAEDAKKIKYFKMALAGQLIGRPIYPNIRTENNPYKLYTTFFLAQVFSKIDKQIRSKYTNRDIAYSVSLGMPVKYQDSTEIKKKFQDVLQAAWYMYPKIKKEESIKVIDILYSEAMQKPEDKKLTTVPELWAETAGMFNHSLTQKGYYAIFDIGGGTVDGTLVKYSRQDGHSVIEFITAEVEPIGIEVAVHNMVKTRGQDQIAKIRSLLFYKDNDKDNNNLSELKDLQKSIYKHTATVIVNANKKGFKIESEYKEKLPVVFCGGGKTSWWYRNAILSTYKEHKHFNYGIPPYKTHEINEEQGVFAGIDCPDKHRFLVALGLSIPPGSDPLIQGLPHEYPKVEKTEEKNVQLDLDDLQREKYGDDR